MKYVCAWLIRFYQKFLSPLKRTPTCRFYPSCSAFALEAFINRGFFVGFGLTVWRILRCHPFCAGGFDPVPEGKHKKIPKYDLESVKEDNNKDEVAARDNDSTANN